eukprot:c8836_g1_i2.p1 GENE.c8836_g1_i2~~c8836_g1_i2.p1  ORF type:complete len:257 (-),score=32.91 c8836_g1_i2:87-857(-)
MGNEFWKMTTKHISKFSVSCSPIQNQTFEVPEMTQYPGFFSQGYMEKEVAAQVAAAKLTADTPQTINPATAQPSTQPSIQPSTQLHDFIKTEIANLTKKFDDKFAAQQTEIVELQTEIMKLQKVNEIKQTEIVKQQTEIVKLQKGNETMNNKIVSLDRRVSNIFLRSLLKMAEIKASNRAFEDIRELSQEAVTLLRADRDGFNLAAHPEHHKTAAKPDIAEYICRFPAGSSRNAWRNLFEWVYNESPETVTFSQPI